MRGGGGNRQRHADGLQRAVNVSALQAETERQTAAEGDELRDVEEHVPELHRVASRR